MPKLWSLVAISLLLFIYHIILIVTDRNAAHGERRGRLKDGVYEWVGVTDTVILAAAGCSVVEMKLQKKRIK